MGADEGVGEEEEEGQGEEGGEEKTDWAWGRKVGGEVLLPLIAGRARKGDGEGTEVGFWGGVLEGEEA